MRIYSAKELTRRAAGPGPSVEVIEKDEDGSYTMANYDYRFGDLEWKRDANNDSSTSRCDSSGRSKKTPFLPCRRHRPPSFL